MLKKLLIILSVICSIFAVLIVMLPFMNNANIDTQIKGSNDMQVSYTSTEEDDDTNTWDVSAKGDKSVIATLSEEGTLTISGTGPMKDWGNSDVTDWHIYEKQKKIREVIINEGVTTIGSNAFYCCEFLTNVEIPDSVTSIARDSFLKARINKFVNIGIVEIELPELLKIAQETDDTSIMDVSWNFENCTIEGTKVKIASGVTSAKIKITSGNLEELSYCFYYDTWDISKNIHNNVIAKMEEDYTLTISGTGKMKDFGYLSDEELIIRKLIKKINIESGITNIGQYAFLDCSSVTNIEIPNTVMNIESNAFERCSNLIELKIPEGIEIIRMDMFKNCSSLRTIELPDSVMYIDDGVFRGCSSLESIKLPKGLTKMDFISFGGCTSLKTIEIPSGVQGINSYMFGGCTGLINIEVDENNPYYIDYNGVLYTKKDLYSEQQLIRYPAGRTEKEYAILKGVTGVDGQAFADCSNLEKVEIPEGVKGITGFENCPNLKYLKIPSSVTGVNIKDNDIVTILCYKGSAAEAYAIKYKIRYELLTDKITSTSTTQKVDEVTETIKGINPNTTAVKIIENIQSEETYEIIDLEGKVISNTSKIGTGYKLKLSSGKEYTIVVRGDISGDGEIKISELARASRLGISQEGASEIEIMAIDVNMDGSIKVNDLAAISRLARE